MKSKKEIQIRRKRKIKKKQKLVLLKDQQNQLILARLTKTERGFKLISSGKRGNETFVHTKMYTQVFTAVLFIITKSKNHPNIHQLQNG